MRCVIASSATRSSSVDAVMIPSPGSSARIASCKIRQHLRGLAAADDQRLARRRWVICDGYEASLEIRKVYETITDPDAEGHGQLRVVDESGDDYLFPARYFGAIELPAAVRRAVNSAT